MSNPEKLEFAEKAKEMGTAYFKKGQYGNALKKYNQITEYLELEPEDMDGMSGQCVFKSMFGLSDVILGGKLFTCFSYQFPNKLFDFSNSPCPCRQ